MFAIRKWVGRIRTKSLSSESDSYSIIAPPTAPTSRPGTPSSITSEDQDGTQRSTVDPKQYQEDPEEPASFLVVAGLPYMHERVVKAEMRRLFKDFTVIHVSGMLPGSKATRSEPGHNYVVHVTVPIQEAGEAIDKLHNGSLGYVERLQVTQHKKMSNL